MGRLQGQLKSISYTAYDPSISAMNTISVEDYLYDSNGRLRDDYDPRLSSPLETTYAYDSSNRVSTVTPPGVNSWTINYNSANQVTSTVRNNDQAAPRRPRSSTACAERKRRPLQHEPIRCRHLGTARRAHQCDGDLSRHEVPSGNPPSDYTQATVYYTDADGQLVNVAQPGGEISTTEYDQNGNVVRTLSPLDRQTALAAGSQSAAVATTLDTRTPTPQTAQSCSRLSGRST